MNAAGFLFLVALVLFLVWLCSGPGDEWDPGLPDVPTLAELEAQAQQAATAAGGGE